MFHQPRARWLPGGTTVTTATAPLDDIPVFVREVRHRLTAKGRVRGDVARIKRRGKARRGRVRVVLEDGRRLTLRRRTAR